MSVDSRITTFKKLLKDGISRFIPIQRGFYLFEMALFNIWPHLGKGFMAPNKMKELKANFFGEVLRRNNLILHFFWGHIFMMSMP